MTHSDSLLEVENGKRFIQTAGQTGRQAGKQAGRQTETVGLHYKAK